MKKIAFVLAVLAVLGLAAADNYRLQRSRQQTERCIAGWTVSIDELNKSLDREKELIDIVDQLRSGSLVNAR